ncbi:MAG: 2'-5' RNA ligase family protein [Clostridia bacterium]|nr:2'-5' RNA ligase family protein [Clostridia bacterium]
MAEQFLTLMADFDDNTQREMEKWYASLKDAGFTGTQTPNLPYHISLGVFPLDKEQYAIGIMEKAAKEFAPFPVHLSHIGIFAPGKVLFAAPERNAQLDALREATDVFPNPHRPWTPHATILIDESEIICKALTELLKSFHPILASVTRLHLCAFWPKREIGSALLTGEK